MVEVENEVFWRVFPEKLRFWTKHCLINALPNYLIAVIWVELWSNLAAQLAMAAAVGTFILAYAFVTSLPGPLARMDSLISHALKVALKVRIGVSVMTLCVVPLGEWLIFTPDAWCGHLALELVDSGYLEKAMKLRGNRS